jgi:hypothetical protein
MILLRRFTSLTAVISLLALTQPAFGAGSIAYSASARASGAASNYPKQSDADAAAKSECGDATCNVVVQFTDSCGALAADPASHASAAATGGTVGAARTNALARCNAIPGSSCQVVITKCDGAADN